MSRISRTRIDKTPAGHPLGGCIGVGADDLRNVPFDTEWLVAEFVPITKGLVIILTPRDSRKSRSGEAEGVVAMKKGEAAPASADIKEVSNYKFNSHHYKPFAISDNAAAAVIEWLASGGR